MLDKINPSEIFKFCSAGTGACISYFFGGGANCYKCYWHSSLSTTLPAFLPVHLRASSSAVGRKGIAKKVFIFVIVAIAHLVDVCLG